MQKLDQQKDTDTVVKQSWLDELLDEWGFTKEAKQKKAAARRADVESRVDELHEGASFVDDYLTQHEQRKKKKRRKSGKGPWYYILTPIIWLFQGLFHTFMFLIDLLFTIFGFILKYVIWIFVFLWIFTDIEISDITGALDLETKTQIDSEMEKTRTEIDETIQRMRETIDGIEIEIKKKDGTIIFDGGGPLNPETDEATQ